MSLAIRVLAGSLDGGAGSQVYNRELIGRLAARGHRVSVVCFKSSNQIESVAEVAEIPHRGYITRPAIWPVATWLEHRHLRRGFSRRTWQQPDVVIAAEHLFITAHARRFPATPMVYLPHSLLVTHEIESYELPRKMERVTMGVYRHIQMWALQHAAVTLRFTKIACDVLAAAYPSLKVRRFAVNPMGIDLPKESRTPAVTGDVRLLYVGRLIPQKRVDLILAALSEVPSRQWTLDIVGGGPLRDALERQAADLGLQRVRFHGFQSDPASWYRRSDLLLLTSRSESFGMVLLEAMSHGVPCLALLDDGVTSFNVNREIIDHDRTGILADGDAGFRRELANVLAVPARLEPLGRAARITVAESWTWGAHLDRYEQLFEQLTARRADSVQPG